MHWTFAVTLNVSHASVVTYSVVFFTVLELSTGWHAFVVPQHYR